MTINTASPVFVESPTTETTFSATPIVKNVVTLKGNGAAPRLILLGKNNEVVGQMASRNLFMTTGSQEGYGYGTAWEEGPN